jgi:Uncharacterized conserved protein
MWIEQFRNIKNQGLVVDDEFIIEVENPEVSTVNYFSEDGIHIHYSGLPPAFARKVFERSIKISPNPQYMRKATEPITNITALVGENATGKSSILECLNSQCDQFNYRNKEQKFYFLVFFDEQNNSVVVRTRDIRLKGEMLRKQDTRQMSGYEEYLFPFGQGCEKAGDISQFYSLSLQKEYGEYMGYFSMGLPVACSDMSRFTYKNSFSGIFDFLCDFKEFGGTENNFVVYLEDEDSRRNGTSYYAIESLHQADYKSYFIHKLLQTLFSNLRKYLFHPKQEYSMANTLISPASDQNEKLTQEDFGCVELLSFANLHYPHPDSPSLISVSCRDVADIPEKASAVLEYFSKCTFIHSGRFAYDKYLGSLARLIQILCSTDEQYFTSLYKLELPFEEEYKSIVAALSECAENDNLNGNWTTGVAFEFEWLSAGEAHFALLFSAIYKHFTKVYNGFDKRHIILSIDEPEMHMHPEVGRVFLQKLKQALAEFQRKGVLGSCQVILATHSPFIVQGLNDFCSSISLISKVHSEIKVESFQDVDKIKYPNHLECSFGLVMYKIFGVPTVELHNELYGILQEKSEIYHIEDRERGEGFDTWLSKEGCTKSRKWIKLYKGKPQAPVDVTLSTYIRNSIHHPENKKNVMYSQEELVESLEEMLFCIYK